MTQDYGLGPYFPGARITFPTLRHVVNDLRPNGFALEFGVAEGTSLSIISAHMPTVGFDSFEGLPEAWGPYPAGLRACPSPDCDARLVTGLFADTLPAFDFGGVDPIGLVHVDCDLYSSTKTVLKHVGPHLRPGCYIVFDEWCDAGGGLTSWYAEHEQRAWREYTKRTSWDWTVVGHDDEAWAIRLDEIGS